VRGFQKLEAAVFDERNIPPCQFDLELGRVIGRSKKNGLGSERYSFFTRLQDPIGDIAGLARLVGDRCQAGFQV
jgi:hypothetical protein